VRHPSGTASVTYKLFFGATSITPTSGTFATQFMTRAYVCNDPGATNSQQINHENQQRSGAAPDAVIAPTTAAENTAAAVVVKFTFNVANTDTVRGCAGTYTLCRRFWHAICAIWTAKQNLPDLHADRENTGVLASSEWSGCPNIFLISKSLGTVRTGSR
jgi:hypothetical protein